MFDLNGDGEVDVGEFETVRDVVLNSTSIGHRHRDRSTTGNVAGSVGDALVDHFFGLKRDGKLTIEKFKEFHEQLLREILRLEVNTSNNACTIFFCGPGKREQAWHCLIVLAGLIVANLAQSKKRVKVVE